MAICHFAREIAIAAPRDRVFAELAEPARFLGLQPLLAEVREVPAAAGVRAFEAVERVPLLGRIAMRNRLRVELTPLPAQDSIRFATRAPLGIWLVGAFDLHAEGPATRVRESVQLHCPLVLRRFVAREAIRAQETLLANLKRRLEVPLG